MNQLIRQPTPEVRALTPRADVYETTTAYHFELELPGVDPAAIDVQCERGVLTISGETPAREPQGLSLAHQEFASGVFRRAFRLPDDADTDGTIEAAAKHGVLSVSVPKRKSGARKIEIRSR
ncbi:MAG: Hsp20/alpha crystallin family protein [Planctomycetes bacterium]|nr:Hsp20/alpha crystallin family protein [Planctomycetota bacterium]